MIFLIKDGNNITQGRGFSLNEAVAETCEINELIGEGPTNPEDVKKLIDVGALRVREIQEPELRIVIR